MPRMARKTILIDDFDGKELPEDTKPIRLSIDRKTWAVYLSDDNYGKLLEALEPFIKDAEQGTNQQAPSQPKNDRARTQAIREWAQANDIKQPNGKPLGDRGRIPDEIVKQYDAAH